MKNNIVETITERIKAKGASYLCNDNIAQFISEDELPLLQMEITERAQAFLQALIIDTNNDHNTKETAARIAKTYLHELFSGRYQPAPQITSFPNVKKYNELYITEATIRSTCAHHFAPIIGKCWIGIIPGNTVLGLSKFNRIVEWVASRPQIQEELVVQIYETIEKYCSPRALAVCIRAEHLCMTWRGVKEHGARMTTNKMSPLFLSDKSLANEFLTFIKEK